MLMTLEVPMPSLAARMLRSHQVKPCNQSEVRSGVT